MEIKRTMIHVCLIFLVNQFITRGIGTYRGCKYDCSVLLFYIRIMVLEIHHNLIDGVCMSNEMQSLISIIPGKTHACVIYSISTTKSPASM